MGDGAGLIRKHRSKAGWLSGYPPFELSPFESARVVHRFFSSFEPSALNALSLGLSSRARLLWSSFVDMILPTWKELHQPFVDFPTCLAYAFIHDPDFAPLQGDKSLPEIGAKTSL